MSEDDFWALVGFFFLLGLVIFGVWMFFLGPCWLYSFASVGEIPVRCLAVLAG